jgi:serine/threonine protein phosphatase PrpC
MTCSLHVGSVSAAGVRTENQDRVTHFDSPFGQVFILADGMGGYSGGATAAAIATSPLPEIMRSLPASMAPQDALVESIGLLNRVIHERARADGDGSKGMGSTLAVLLVRHTDDGSLAIGAHVGDSRIYFMRGGRLFCLTQDHTVVQRMVDDGVLTPQQAFDHPQAHVLTRALGHAAAVAVDLTSWTLLEPGDLFLLCSDGLSGYAADDDIRRTLAHEEPPEAVARRLLDLALREQSQDNISALVVRAA